MNPYGRLNMINEAEIATKWGPMIESSTGVTEKSKLGWMSKIAHFHELYENNGYATLGSVNGMGNTNLPNLSGTNIPGGLGAYAFNTQNPGSGDKAHTLLPIAMQVAANTVGLDLVPVVPMPGPMGVLTYLDYVYAGGKLAVNGQLDNPLLVKVSTGTTGTALLTANTKYFVTAGATSTGKAAYVEYLGASRIDGYAIFKIISTGNGAITAYTAADGVKVSEVFLLAGHMIYASTSATVIGAFVQQGAATASLVKGLEDHIAGFSGGDYENPNPYSRGTGESTADNTMNLSLYNKSVEAKTFQVAAAVTREQVQDLKQFGIDAVSQVEAVLVNELTQSINKNILDRLFRLGNKNHYLINTTQGVNFHLNIGNTSATLAVMGLTTKELKDSDDASTFATSTSIAATEGTNISSAENLHTRQRKIMSKILAASNMIAIRGRRGAATFAVTNGQIATALQDCAGFVAAPMANAINQMGGALFPVGTLAGVAIYVDPNMDWNDNRVCIGRKGDGNSPGLVFMPYLMAESVETIAEGTMAPKIAIKSRYALVEAGHHPEANYITFAVYSQFGGLV